MQLDIKMRCERAVALGMKLAPLPTWAKIENETKRCQNESARRYWAVQFGLDPDTATWGQIYEADILGHIHKHELETEYMEDHPDSGDE